MNIGDDSLLNGKKVLVSSCAGLGDLLMFTPALRRLKELYPQCTLTFMTNAPYRSVLERIPYIDQVICIQRKKMFGRFRVVKELIHQDYVIFTDWQPQLLVCAYFFRIPHRIGIPKSGHSLNHYFTKMLSKNVMLSSRYAAETNALIFSEALDTDIDGDMTQPDISMPNLIEVQTVDAMLTSEGLASDIPYICLAPFAGMEQRNWPQEYITEFLQLLSEQMNIPVVLIGPADKRHEAAGLGAYNLVGKTTVLEMVEIIRRSKLFIGPDSGPMHIAGALNIPSIAFFTKDLPSRWAPRRDCRVLTAEMSCSPCNDETARQCSTLECMKRITPEWVFDTVREILG